MDAPVLTGHFARFNEWTEIDSREGHFLERIAPGAFKRTLAERTPKALFQHGKDPYLGLKPIGTVRTVAEDAVGARYEVDLFPGLPDLLVDGLRAGQYGASFQFATRREEYVQFPGRSDYNPDGIPERTLQEVRVPEFSVVTFPAYQGASASARSSWRAVEIATDSTRPPDSGWGLLTAARSGTLRRPDELVEIRAGRTRIAPDHWMASARPEWWTPAAGGDRQTAQRHLRKLAQARRDLERQPSPRVRARVLPPKGGPAFRLPRAAPPSGMRLPL